METLRKEFAIPLESLVPGAQLVDDLDLDSIDAIDFSVQLEIHLGYSPKGADLRRMRTIRDVVDFLYANQPPVEPAREPPA